MNILALFSSFAVAAEIIISPLAADYNVPTRTFANLRNQKSVLGIQNTPEPTPSLAPVLQKENLRIALLGDSMIDTVDDIPELQDELKKTYSNISVEILNYGVGATNIDYGIERVTHDYDYLGNHFPALQTTNPDIVVIESFGYNPYPFDNGALDKHWLALAKLVDVVKTTMPQAKIVMAATIAPNANVFGDGAPGLSFGPEDKYKRTRVIKSYLESTTRFAAGQYLPLADAYHESLEKDGNGNIDYINEADHIHPSGEGRKLFAQVLAQALIENKLLE